MIGPYPLGPMSNPCVPNFIHATKPFAQLPLPLWVSQKNLSPYSTKPLSVRCLHMPLLDGSHSFCNTATNHLEVLHRAACKVITGCLFSTPSSLLLLEAQLPPLKLTLEHQTLYSFERALRLPPTSPAFMPWQLETFPVDYRRNPPVDLSVLQPHNHSHPHASL